MHIIAKQKPIALACILAISISCVASGKLWSSAISTEHGKNESRGLKTCGSKADADWEAIFSGGPRLVRKAGEKSLAFFMRDVEQSNIRLRELGHQFWIMYPRDSRRYKWLLLTVHLPPYYSQNIDEWAEYESKGITNAALQDREAIRNWNSDYQRMRADFWKAREVTDQERRFLWFGELVQALRRMREATERG